MTAEEHFAAIWAVERADHEALVAKIRSWAEAAETNGDELRARRHRDHIARLEAIPKPWAAKAA
jgi:hypothetical protein